MFKEVPLELLSECCSRCGRASCLGVESPSKDEQNGAGAFVTRRCALSEFSKVHTMCNLDHPIGQSLYRYKRYGNPLDGSLVVLTLIQGIISLVERLCSEGGPAEVVLLPISNESFLSGRTHPNLLIYEGLRSRLAEPKKSPRPLLRGPDFNARSVPVWLGLHAGKSRSLGRRAAAAQMPQGESEQPEPCARELNGFEAWQMEDLKWIGGRRFAAAKHPEACGAQTIFVDDVLTSGYTAARVASIVDPQMKTVWTMVAAARAVYRSS